MLTAPINGHRGSRELLLGLLLCWSFSISQAQPPRFQPPVNSPEVAADGKVTFRLRAADVSAVRLTSSDLPEAGQGLEMQKGEEGVWQLELTGVRPGTYRYRFDIAGVPVSDPANPATSESNGNSWSLVHVPGTDWMDNQQVPHGAVSEVFYFSQALKKPRRMHVYTPPGYELGSTEKYPVFYLLHGALDCDDSWTTVGRAGFIVDNLLAAGKAQPMIIVMPAGHTGPFSFGPGGLRMEEFVEDFVTDIKPYIESHYRVRTERENTAIAGLSMGGAHTLSIAIPHLEQFAYMGVFSSGVFGITGAGPGAGNTNGPSFAEQHAATLKNTELHKGLKLCWFATGKEDFLLETSRATVAMLKEQGLTVEYRETEGGHTWINWREYLHEFVPLLFQPAQPAAQTTSAVEPPRNGETQRPEGRRMSRAPEPGPYPLPTLSALPGLDDESFYAVRDVPHGRVDVVNYENFEGHEKRMHIYLPPGYDAAGDRRFPVLYLNHGGGDDDSKWTSDDRQGGHAQHILDNLIADQKAKPMLVVMPNTRGLAAADPPPTDSDDACTREYLENIIPYVDSHYRTVADRNGRALAGLSMGGFVVMHTGLARLDTFSELYVYSSGHFPDKQAAFEERFKSLFADPQTNQRLNVPLYFASGETDIALRNGQGDLAIVNKYGLRNFWVLSTGGHEWANWRRYLHQTTQIMFPGL